MDDFALAIAVAYEGATFVRDRFGTKLERLDKGLGDFATNADIEAEQAMLALLRRERPQDAVLGEESGSSGTANSSRILANRSTMRHAQLCRENACRSCKCGSESGIEICGSRSG